MDLRLADDCANLANEIRATLQNSILGQSDTTSVFRDIIERVDATIARAQPEVETGRWELIAAGLRVLANHEASLRIAQTGVGNLLEERGRGDILAEDLRQKLSSAQATMPKSLEPTCRALINNIGDHAQIRSLLVSIPLPTLYWSREQPSPMLAPFRGEASPSPNQMVRVIAFLDREPVASPQFLSQGKLYRLTFQLRSLGWPDEAIRLRVNLNTTCPPEVYGASVFALDKPSDTANGDYSGQATGHIIFNAGQSNLLDDLVFTVHAAFETEDGELAEVPVIGHNELRIKVVDSPNWLPSTGGRPMDQHIIRLLEELIREYPSIQGEMTELYPLIEALVRVCATYAQEAAFKGRNDVSEKEFQQTVLRDLRFSLGASDVQEHPKQAGGIPDIRFRGVIVELKVEDEDGDRSHLAAKYAPQATQYAGAEARQVSILLVLDLTEKANPPGDIRNDIFVADVHTHGTDDAEPPFPAKALIFVVNGNTRNPSSYSR